MLEPGTERVRLDPISLDPPDGVRILPSDGSVEMHVRGPWLLVWTLFFALLAMVVVLGIGVRRSPIEIAGWATLTTLLFLALLFYGDRGTTLVKVWRFGPDRISRDIRLALPASLWPREFRDIEDFEIVHQLYATGIGSRSLLGGHQDTLRFWVAGRTEPLTVMQRANRYSDAILRGALFTQDRAGEIEREILPDVLGVAVLAAGKVGVPLYVIEKTYWVAPDSDG